MNCKVVQQHFDDRIARRSNGDFAKEIQEHLNQCQACRAFYHDIRQLQEILKRAELPLLPASIRQRLNAPVAPPAHMFRWSAAAALLLLTFGLGFFAASRRSPEPSVSVGTHRVARNIVMAIDSANDRHGVTLRLLLPPGVEVDGHPGATVLEWQDDLSAGVNRLRIPLIFSGGEHGVLVTQLEYQGKIQELKVQLGHWVEKPLTQSGESSPRRIT